MKNKWEILKEPGFQGKLLLALSLLSLVLSLLVRIPALRDHSFWWRAAQTESTVYWFQQEGIDLIDYQTPIYGPPWQVPFEFPLFQAMAALIGKIGHLDSEFSSRLAALFSFYLSALFLYLASQKIFRDKFTSHSILFIYLWTPYNIYYSTEPLIDFLALAMGFGYFYLILVWLDNRSKGWNALAAFVCGALGYLIKPSVMPIVVIPILAAVILDAKERGYFSRPFTIRSLWGRVKVDLAYWVILAAIGILPVLLGYLWTKHADLIKGSSVFTQWLTSTNLPQWYFGTWAQRLNISLWYQYIHQILWFLLPYAFFPFALLGFAGLRKTSLKVALIVPAFALGVFATLSIFLNLFQHEYYYICFTASMAILTGFGIRRFLQLTQKVMPDVIYLAALALLITAAFCYKNQYRPFRARALDYNNQMASTRAWVREIQQYVSTDEWVVFVEDDWNPLIPYLFERKTMVVTWHENDDPICSILSDSHFTLLVDRLSSDITVEHRAPEAARALSCFRVSEMVMPYVYRVSH